MTADLRPLHRRALADASALVGQLRPAELVQPTPCPDWNLAALLEHMIGQHHGFALAVQTGDAGESAYTVPVQDLATDWPASVDRLQAAFAAAELDRPVRLVEISPDLRFPAGVAIGFQLLDTVVHSWDIARSLGRDYRPDDELLTATLALARQVPGGESRTRPGAAFGPEVATGTGSDRWLETLARLGRSPG